MKFKDKYTYYAVAKENSYYVKKGETQVIPANELEQVIKTGKFGFDYADNMHWDEDILPCNIIKETKHFELIELKTISDDHSRSDRTT